MDFTRAQRFAVPVDPAGITKSEEDPFKRPRVPRDRVEKMLGKLLNTPRATAVDPTLATARARADRVNLDLFLDMGWTRGLDLTVSENWR